MLKSLRQCSFCEQKVITLIALIITIIVLLILAGSTMAILIGDNGILTKATEASFRQEMSEVREKDRFIFNRKSIKC